MKRCYWIILFFAISFFAPGTIRSQDAEGAQPGKISASDFEISSPLIDSSTAAVVISDIGSCTLENYQNAWRISFTKTMRMKILNRHGLDALTISIFYSAEDNKDGKLKKLKGFTYNLDNGKVISTSIPSKDFFVTRTKNSDLLEEKFTFPNASVGSIVEYSYTVNSSNILTLVPWEFQGKYPRLWSEYSVTLPEFFNYAIITQGLIPFYKKSIDSALKETWIGYGNADLMIYTTKWVMKDVPEVKNEPFVYCTDNYVSKIHFQISARPQNVQSVGIFRTWQSAANLLLTDGFLGAAVSGENRWLNLPMGKMLPGSMVNIDKAKKIFSFVRDSFNSPGTHYHPDLQQVFEKHEGTNKQINLLLLAMLKKANIFADPVILATRDNGLTNTVYPIMEKINYTIVRINIGGKVFFLDASQKKMGFGKLPLKCYNGHARVIRQNCYPVFFEPDSLLETSTAQVSIRNNEKGEITGDFVRIAGYYESLYLRDQLSEKKQADYFRDIAKSFLTPIQLDHPIIDSLQQYDAPLTIRYSIKLDPGNEQTFYFNPLLNEAIKENPFAASLRVYPVELPFTSYKDYVLDMEIPKGYKIEELPASEHRNLNEKDGYFQYLIENKGEHIRLECHMAIQRSTFPPEYYQALRDFYAFVIKKESEMIVFKKINSRNN